MRNNVKAIMPIAIGIVLIIVAAMIAGCSGSTKTPVSPGSNVTNANNTLNSSQASSCNNSCICGNCSCLADNASCVVPAVLPASRNDTRVKLTMDDARVIAFDYAKKHFEGFQTLNMTLSKAELLDHGSGGVEYYFVWTEMVGSAYTLNGTILTVNATTGDINKYYESYGPAPVDVSPSISKDQAIAIATGTDYFKDYRPDSVEATLYTGYGSRPQRLNWRVDILCNFNVIDSTTGMAIPDHRGGQVTVDAMTGDVIDINPCY